MSAFRLVWYEEEKVIVARSACSVCDRKTVLMSVSTCSAERVLLRESVREMITKESDY